MQEHFYSPCCFSPQYDNIGSGQKTDNLGRKTHVIYYISSAESDVINPLTTLSTRCSVNFLIDLSLHDEIAG